MRLARFSDDAAKARWLAAAARLDAADPRIVELAHAIAPRELSRPEAAERLFAWVRDRIAYRPDRAPDGERREVLADAWTVAARRWDDCDGKARLFVALALARGLPAEIVPVWRRGEFAHVAARVDRGTGWESADPTMRRAWIGALPEDVPRDARGRIEV